MSLFPKKAEYPFKT